jgi:hypothetical protein
VNGLQRSVTALTFVEADPSAKKLAQVPESVATVFAACGKVKKPFRPRSSSALRRRAHRWIPHPPR